MRNTITFSSQTEQIFINRSKELIHMNTYERMKFLYDHSDIKLAEKARVIDTYICILEKVEDFESCESLLELKRILLKGPKGKTVGD